MHLQVDPTTKQLLSISNEIKPLTADGKPLYPAVPAVQAIVDRAKADADAKGALKVGAITGSFYRARQSDNTTENRGGESTLGNFVADVQQATTGADVGLARSSGLRANLTFPSSGPSDPAGTVTYREAAKVLPSTSTLMTLTLTGAQLRSVLEEQWQPTWSTAPFLKLGVSKGLTYTYDPSAGKGARITSLTLNGTPVDPAASYTVATNTFLAEGGDNFATFRQGTNRHDTGAMALEAMVDWFDAHTTAAPDPAQRAVGATLSRPDADGYSAGDTVTVSLSSLAFSAGGPAPGAVTLSLGGTPLATGTVDPAVVDSTDESGRAALTFTVPSGVRGAQLLTVAVPATGTTAQVPITIAGAAVFTGTLALGSPSTVAGGRLAIAGSGFTPNAALTVSLRPTEGAPAVEAPLVAGSTGAFGASLVVPKGIAPGAYTVVVTQADGQEATAKVIVVRSAEEEAVIRKIADLLWDLVAGW
jgi:5'-nucleotidase